jgi:hypothetical protein
MLAFALLLSPSVAVRAAEQAAPGMKPVLVVGFSGYDELRKDLDWIGKLGGNPTLGAMLETNLKQQLGTQEFAGLDQTRPWGLVVESDGQEFGGYAFLPVTDLGQFLKTFEQQIGKPKDAGDGVKEIDVQGRPMYVKGVGKWAFLSISPDGFSRLPKDPVAQLDGLTKDYDLAMRVIVRNVPPMARQMLLATMQMGMQMGMERQPGESEADHALRTKMAREAIDQMTNTINDLDTLLIGVALDPKAAVGRLDYMVTAVEGTKTAKQMAQPKQQKTQFAGLLQPGAAVTLVAASELTESNVSQAKLTIESRKKYALDELERQGLGPDELKLAKQLINDLTDVIQRTLEGKHWDGGMAAFLGPDRATVVAASRVADAAKLDQLIKDLVQQATKDQPAIAEMIKLNAEEYQGFRFHRANVPTEELGQFPNLPKLVGQSLEVILAIGPEAAYLSVGRDATQTLKQVIDKSKADAGKTIPPMQLTVVGSPIAKLIALIARDDDAKQVANKVATMLEQSDGKDRLTSTTTPVPNGMQVRVELQQGLLKVLGAIPTLAGNP